MTNTLTSCQNFADLEALGIETTHTLHRREAIKRLQPVELSGKLQLFLWTSLE